MKRSLIKTIQNIYLLTLTLKVNQSNIFHSTHINKKERSSISLQQAPTAVGNFPKTSPLPPPSPLSVIFVVAH